LNQLLNELIYRLQYEQEKDILKYLNQYYENDRFNTEIVLWNENFSEVENLEFLSSLEKCVQSLFPDMRLKFINKDILSDSLKYGNSKIKLDYSLGFDINITSYILHSQTTNKCFKEMFNQVKENNWDIIPYIVENYLKFQDDFFTDKSVYKNIFKVFKLIYSEKSDESIKNKIKFLFDYIKNNKELFKEFKDNHLRLQIFISGLIYANLHFSKKEKKVKYIMELFDTKIGRFMKREFIYSIKFFEKNKNVINFFTQKTNLNINEFDLIKNIENLAYDLLLIRNMEYYFSLKQVRPNMNVDFFVPFIFSGDEYLLKLLNEVKIKALIITYNEKIKKITPVYFDDISSLIEKYNLEDFFYPEKIEKRFNKKVDLEKNLDEIQKNLIEEFIQKKESKLKNKKYKQNILNLKESKKCIYCNQIKNAKEFSLEHIFPSALGGKYLDYNLFKTHNVCKDCNNRFGLYVDGMFLKSFFIKNEIFNHYLDWIEENENMTIPFVFMGTLEEAHINHPYYKYCDYWIWAGGSRVYHFHNNYNQFFNSYVGGHPIKFKNKKEAGEVYLVGAKENIDEKLFKIMLFSFKEHFKYQKRFSVNIKLNLIDRRTKKNNKIKFFDEPDEMQKNIKNKILKIANQEHKLLITIQQGNEWKFLSKLSIGLGYNLFGNDYLESKDYKIFYNIINAENIDEIKNILMETPVMGDFLSNMTSSLKNIGKIMAFKGGHTLLFQIINNELYFVMWLYNEKYPFVIKILSDVSKFKKNELLEKYKNGFVYLCIPAKKISIGPMDLLSYMAYLIGDDRFLDKQQKEQLDDLRKE
jgi:hypothetical protein